LPVDAERVGEVSVGERFVTLATDNVPAVVAAPLVAVRTFTRRVTRDALAVETPIWILEDSAYDILDWHDDLLAAGVVPIAPYNP
jgi:hypothetical protein